LAQGGHIPSTVARPSLLSASPLAPWLLLLPQRSEAQP